MLDGVDGVKWVWVCVSVGCRGGGVGVDVWMCGCCGTTYLTNSLTILNVPYLGTSLSIYPYSRYGTPGRYSAQPTPGHLAWATY